MGGQRRGICLRGVTRRYWEEIKGHTFTLDFLAFCFVQTAQALLNSTPQLLARDRRAVAQLGPGDLQMDAGAQAAVGAGDDVFAADDFSKRDDQSIMSVIPSRKGALRHELHCWYLCGSIPEYYRRLLGK